MTCDNCKQLKELTEENLMLKTEIMEDAPKLEHSLKTAQALKHINTVIHSNLLMFEKEEQIKQILKEVL